MNKKEEKNRVGGISANRLVIPVVVILAVLHLMILSVIDPESKPPAVLGELGKRKRCPKY